MKNIEIIAEAAIKAGAISKEVAEKYLKAGEDIPFHTVQGWAALGNYKIKDGEEGTEVKLWKKRDNDDSFYMAKAKFYRQDQLETIK